MDNNKDSILYLVSVSGKDIVTFLAEKYDLPRSVVKQYVFAYAYSGSIISNPDSLKFIEPETDYQKLINDYIDYNKECAKFTMEELLTQRRKYEDALTHVAVKKEDIAKFNASVRSIDETLKELFGEENVIRDTVEI